MLISHFFQLTQYYYILNPLKTLSITIILSMTPHPLLILSELRLEVSSSLKIPRVTIDAKLTFESDISNIDSSIAQKTGLIRICYKSLNNNAVVLESFYAFILPCFKYCSASDLHLKLLDCAL